MSTGYKKNKEKRHRSSSSEANTSFVQNVTSKVSGFLPATITKWFNSPSTSSANGSAPTAEATDSSTEDEAPDTQPPAKRMRYTMSAKYNHFVTTEANNSSNEADVPGVSFNHFSNTPYPPSRSTIIITPMRNPNEDSAKEKSEKDTSVYKTQVQHTVASIGQSVANRRKSIFETSNKKEETITACKKTSLNAVKDPKQPYFKPSLLGSPFYPGRTVYGGASSSYVNEPNIRQHTVALVNESKSSEDSALSSSVRRIMDLLESYSSPLSEARRIPQYTRPKYIGNTLDLTNSHQNKSFSHRTQELHVPSIASIMQLKKKSRLMETTKTARQIIASHSSATNYPPYHSASEPGKEETINQSNHMTTKIKSRLTRMNRGSQDESVIFTPVKLPSVGLNIDKGKLPTFDTPEVSKMPRYASSTPINTVLLSDNKKSADISTSKPETVTSSVFKFANPVRISCDTPEPNTITPKFLFESPERRNEKSFEIKEDKTCVVIGTVKETETEKSSTIPVDWKCTGCWVPNKPDSEKCICCGTAKSTSLPKCCVCKVAHFQSQKDKCDECAKKELSQMTSTNPIKAIELGPSSKWKCEECWVSNDSSAEKCACCGSSNTKSNAAPAPASKTPSVLGIIADWKCDDCWVSNKATVDKCVACGGSKPGEKKHTLVPPATSTTSLKKTDKQPQKSNPKWDCPSCLVKNDIDKNACVCCGTNQFKVVAAPTVKFNFGTNLPTFKFGIDPELKDATIAKKPVEPSVIPKEPSETNNNVLPEKPSFTFGIPAKKIDSKVEAPKTNAGEPLKSNFLFGLSKQTPDTEVDGHVTAKSTELAQEEKLQVVPSVNITASVEDVPKPADKLISTPLTQVNSDKPSTSTPTMLTAFTLAKKDTACDAATEAPAVKGFEKKDSLPTFSFGVKKETKSVSKNMFAAPVSTTLAATNTSTMSLFNPPETSTATSLLIGKPAVTSTVSLFQNSAPLTAAVPSTAATVPLFSFGNSTTTAAPAPSTVTASAAPLSDKPKFQFTFGPNSSPKTQSTPIFKAPFGCGNENSTFSLPTGNVLGTSNTITLGGNGLPITNGLAQNSLSGNTVTGNLLPGNGMLGSGLSENTMSGSGQPGNGLVGNTLSSGNSVSLTGPANGLTVNAITGGNGLQVSNALSGPTSLFGNTAQKENMWTSNNTTSPNLFASNNASTNNLHKPGAFAFGSPTPFNASNVPSTFGNNNAAPSSIFGISSTNNNNQPSMFGNPTPNPSSANIFGSPSSGTVGNNQIMFGANNIVAGTPSFCAPNASIASFEPPSQTPASAPTFNFGAQPTPNIFGFSQQAQPQQTLRSPAQPALQTQTVYNFGGAAPAATSPHVQFSIGSGANTAARRMRKAVRRNPR